MEIGETIVIDLETGDPYFDENGSLLLYEGENLLKQSADIMLHTQKGSDILALTYGLDMIGIIQGDYGAYPYDAIRVAIVEAFDELAEPLFRSVDFFQIEEGDPEKYEYTVKMIIFPTNGASFTTQTEIKE